MQYFLGEDDGQDVGRMFAPAGDGRVPGGLPGSVAQPAPFTLDRLAEDWSGGEPVRPWMSVSGTINRFSPQDVPEATWRRVEAVVKDAVTRAPENDYHLANYRMTLVAQLAVWADRIGHDTSAASLFTPEFIDRFITEGCAHLSDGTRLNYRSQLWRIGGAVVGHDLFPPRSVPLRRSALNTPYSTGEVTELVSWSRSLMTEHMRRNCRALLALGLGAGLKAEELTRSMGTDIREEDGVVLVDVLGRGGQLDRVVPVWHGWADEVRVLAEESGARPFFRPDRTRILRRDVLSFIRRCAPEGPPKFNIQQLRITWIVTHLTAGTHLSALQQASGVTANQLVKYLEFVAPLDEARARQLLAGTA